MSLIILDGSTFGNPISSQYLDVRFSKFLAKLVLNSLTRYFPQKTVLEETTNFDSGAW